eukprot:Skav228939  [mRNA]  locus=scaffold2181:356157:357920:- [translate_table: standard]
MQQLLELVVHKDPFPTTDGGNRQSLLSSGTPPFMLAGDPESTGFGEPHQEAFGGERFEGGGLLKQMRLATAQDELPQFPPHPPVHGHLPLEPESQGGSWFRGWLSPRKKPSSPSLPTQLKPLEQVNAGRKTVPKVIKAHVKHQDKLKTALRTAANLRYKGLRDPPIEKFFMAESAKDSKNAKRKTVQLILRELSDAGGPPLSPDLLKGLASALKEGGYTAGEGYLIEGKLWHVEDGHPWSDQLDRVFKLCKRALARGRGPRKRAEEVPPERRRDPGKVSYLTGRRMVKFPGELFKFSMVWMLREIELANMSTDDLLVDFTGKRVTIRLKASKMDQGAQGVRRSLQCLCEKEKCEDECPFHISTDLLSKVEKFNNTGSLLLLTKDRAPATKAQLVYSWKSLYGEGITGHSGRRTGALNYIRSGWSVAQVAHLGRWKSSAILTYAEEALEQVPANLKVPKDSLEKTTSGNAAPESRPLDLEEIKVWKDKLRKEIGVLRKELDEQGKSTSSLQQFWNDLSKEGLNVLPSKLQSLPNKVVHLNMARVSSSPPVTWRTSCGWHFYGSSFNFVSAEVELTCSKCKSFAQTQRG